MNYTRRIAGLDARFVGAVNNENYTKQNSYSSELFINTWVALTEDIAGTTASLALQDRISSAGLLPAINDCASDADKLLHQEQLSDIGIFLIKDLDTRDALQILRFGKRFQPITSGNDGIQKDALRNFKKRNRRNMVEEHTNNNSFICARIKEVIDNIFTSEFLDSLPSRVDFTEMAEDGKFSSGAVAGVKGNALGVKLNDWNVPYYFHYMYPVFAKDVRRTSPYADTIVDQCGVDGPYHRWFKTGDLVMVPKTYKTPRLIVKENVTRGYFMQAILKRLEAMLDSNGYEYLMPSKHQEFNQMLAHIGSVTGQFATVDSSSASDSITCTMIMDLFPKKLVNLWWDLRSSRISYTDERGNTQEFTSYIANTSGSPLCFVMEKIFFYACARVAVDLCVWAGYETSLVTAMGDDIIIPSYAFDTLKDILTHFGIEVNDSKSFWSDANLYRESCGYEAYQGVTTTTIYWPRKAITKNIDSLESLVSLHNNLFLNGWYRAASILKEATTEILGRPMTTSTISELVEWGFVPDLLGFASITHKACRHKYYKHDPKVALEDLPEYMLSERHDHIETVSCFDSAKIKKTLQGPYFMYKYTEYLMHGPLYMNALDELLRVSSSRVSEDDFRTSVKTKVKSRGWDR